MSTKIIEFTRRTIISNRANLFDDPVVVYENDTKIFSTQFGRSTPNPIKPGTERVFDAAYGVLCLGTCNGEVIDHQKHGKCVLLNCGCELPAALPNHSHNNRHVVTEVFIHSSDGLNWPGSAACLTIRKDQWDGFINNFTIGEKVKVTVKGV